MWHLKAAVLQDENTKSDEIGAPALMKSVSFRRGSSFVAIQTLSSLMNARPFCH
jgi:hypothetical protein